MTDQEKLDAAAYNQSYHFDDLVPNEYNGKDNLEIGKIQDDHIYALVHDGQLEDGKIEEGTILKAAWIRKEENGAAKNFLKIQCTGPFSGDLVQDFANIPIFF